MKATSDNAKAARLVGIQIDSVYMYTFGIGAAVAAISAVLMAPLTLFNPDMGFSLFIKGFAAAVLGGFDAAFRVRSWVRQFSGLRNNWRPVMSTQVCRKSRPLSSSFW